MNKLITSVLFLVYVEIAPNGHYCVRRSDNHPPRMCYKKLPSGSAIISQCEEWCNQYDGCLAYFADCGDLLRFGYTWKADMPKCTLANDNNAVTSNDELTGRSWLLRKAIRYTQNVT